MSKRKVCIVGYSPKSRDDAPYGDSSFEFWGLNNLYTVLPDKHWDRWFDMHPEGLIEANNKNVSEDHLEWLAREHDFPIYMLRRFEQFPSSVPYPIHDVQAHMVKDWGFEPGEEKLFHSGVVYPVALALHEGVDEIHLYGIDMVLEEEYGYQRPNMELWVGVARNQPAKNGGKVRVIVGDNCAILKGPGLYGYDSEAFELPLRLERFCYEDRDEWGEKAEKAKAEIEELKKRIEEKRCEAYTYDGARQHAEMMRGKFRKMRRGEAI